MGTSIKMLTGVVLFVIVSTLASVVGKNLPIPECPAKASGTLSTVRGIAHAVIQPEPLTADKRNDCDWVTLSGTVYWSCFDKEYEAEMIAAGR